MKKYILVLLIFILVFVMSACKEVDISQNNVGDPESYYEYGFQDICSDGIKYFSIEEISITSSYDELIDGSNIDSGYYVVVKIDTDLANDELTDVDNKAALALSSQLYMDMNLKIWDEINKNLIFEIPYIETIDYQQLCSLNVIDSDMEYPFLSIFISYYNNYCTINGINYVGRYFMIKLG